MNEDMSIGDRRALDAITATLNEIDRCREAAYGVKHRISKGSRYCLRHGVANAALKRASLDLTRQLAELRRAL